MIYNLQNKDCQMALSFIDLSKKLSFPKDGKFFCIHMPKSQHCNMPDFEFKTTLIHKLPFIHYAFDS